MDIQNGAMMVREGFLLPDSAQIESLSYSKTWRTVTGLDSFAVDRKLRSVGWRLFFIAGELSVSEFGWGTSSVRRAVKRILRRGRKSNLNCIQITQVRHSRMPGFPFVNVRGYLFHIQKDALLASNAQRESEQQDRDWACE
ncbi:MAG TPA: hypothetical protein VFL42_11810 [Terriglobales bacterium]|jgi:hypothetical protein|nr:hypothetical protein [Terriglobales bacterium]